MGLLWQVKAHSPSTLWLWLTPVSPGRMIADGFHHKNARVVLWIYSMTSLVAQMVKHLTTMRETQVRSLGWEDPQEKEMATHSSTLAWKISWTEEHGRLQSMGSQRVGHNWVTSLSCLPASCILHGGLYLLGYPEPWLSFPCLFPSFPILF